MFSHSSPYVVTKANIVIVMSVFIIVDDHHHHHHQQHHLQQHVLILLHVFLPLVFLGVFIRSQITALVH